MRNGAPPQGDPSNRWPWIAVLLGVLVVGVAVAIFLLNRSNTVNINIEGTPTPNPLAGAASPGPPPTLVPPTLAPSASLVPSPTPPPSPTAQPTPTARPTLPPTPTPLTVQVAAPTVPAATPAQAPATGQSPVPGGPAAGTPTGTGPGASTPAAATQPTAPQPTATPPIGQVAAGGGLGNTRSDIDAAYGAPVGETPNHLVVYRKNNFEYHVQLVPDLNGRAGLVATAPQNGQPIALEQAQADAHRLLPRDAQPPNPTPEGSAQFVAERYTSASLAQALSLNSPDFMIVYARDAQGRITRWVLGPGDDPNALLQQGS
ncbi:MAG: hypothetical protein JO020_10545 [Chloroflexi bacterium]|nr:hypothetical protein [Chloroflexota bacterium]